MKIDIITPDKKVFEGEATSVLLPGTDGSFQILNNHANFISSLGQGACITETIDGEKQTIEISGGVVEVIDNGVIVLAESVISE